MKKIYLLILMIMFSTLIYTHFSKVSAKTDDFAKGLLDAAEVSAKQLAPFHRRLYDCSEIKLLNEDLEIYGKYNGFCHTLMFGLDCYLPMDVAKNYSKAFFASVDDLKRGNLSTESAESKYMNWVLNNKNYCKPIYNY